MIRVFGKEVRGDDAAREGTAFEVGVRVEEEDFLELGC
jgi:hypothetical protein